MARTDMPKLFKLEAAGRQLDCAIRLYFDNDDLLAVHGLSRAAFRLLYDLHPANDDYKELVTRTIQYLGWGNINELTNFLKHADRDPDDEADEPCEVKIQIGIGFAAMLYRRMTKRLTPEMKAFHLWMKVSHPEHFPDVREPFLGRGGCTHENSSTCGGPNDRAYGSVADLDLGLLGICPDSSAAADLSATADLARRSTRHHRRGGRLHPRPEFEHGGRCSGRSRKSGVGR
jgi:hypothetical protein